MKYCFLLPSYLCMVTLLLGCSRQEKNREVIPIEVDVLTIGKSDSRFNAHTIGYSGIIMPSTTVTLSFQVPGTVERMPVRMGEFIKKGTLVAEIDEATYRNQYNAQRAQATLAKENYTRINEVYKKGSIAEIRMLQARSQYEQAQAVANATYQNIKHTRLYAPLSGYVGEKMMEAGDVANPGQPVIKLLEISTVKASVPVPDEEINRYHSGDTAVVTIEALGHAQYTGIIDEVAIQTNAGTPAYLARINIHNEDQKIKPGMACTMVLNRHTTPAAIVIPVRTVYVDEHGQNYVYVVNTQNNTAVRRPVETGPLYDNGIAITRGLQAGDQLVTSGYHKLTNNSPVKIAK